jgi:hypothetical protein
VTQTHTPGEWEVYARKYVRIKGTGIEIAEAKVNRPIGATGHQIHEAEMEANARLIAAAPAMAAALDQIVDWLGLDADAEDDGLNNPTFVKSAKMARAALAAAGDKHDA